MVAFIRSDLDFILQQILISEAHADGEDLRSILPNVAVPFGLRTVTGEYNNLLYPEFGAADQPFPRLTLEEYLAQYDPLAPGRDFVTDAQPRTISNLIVDQTATNPAAVAANGGAAPVTSPGLDGIFGTIDDRDVFLIPNVTPDEGLSAPFNAWMTFFGQFFDHGLDLVTKSSTEVIYMPLQPDDPLYVLGSPTNFMILSRTTEDATNLTSPFVDQNQTYSSHPSHQVFLRAYELVGGKPVATGELIENRDLGGDGIYGTDDDVVIGGMATWKVVKAQARDILGIDLTDADVGNVPLLATDAYGNFIPGANGFPQVITTGGPVEGNPASPVSLATALATGHHFLDDIAHNATPFGDLDHNPSTPNTLLTADADEDIGNAVTPGEYDDELLDAHYIAGDGRVNENIGLTAVHAVFHSEHNRLVQQTKDVVLASNDLAFLNQWLLAPVATLPVDQAAIDALQWNGERLFQAAKFGTEMQYQHLVFEEFARTVQPLVDEFLAPNGYDVTIDPSIVAEFAHTVYRFGHSMLTETVDRFDTDFTLVDGTTDQMGLIAAFLNPLAYAASGATPEQATGAIVRGVTRQVGNEIDEFVTEALRNNLVGLPLDLAAINIARGRDTGIPTLNHAREQFYAATGDSQLKPYISWVDFMGNLKHVESLVNFIAAYGTHGSITAATTLLDKRAAATLLVLGGVDEPADRLDFLNATGAYAGGSLGGLNNVDFWIGGLAEKQMPFGGLLGSTFNFVFETQLEALQNGDRFYYLSRTAGMHFGAQLEENSFAKLVMQNSDATHLPAAIFTTPTWILEVDQSQQFTGLGDGRADPTGGIEIDGVEITPLVIRDNPDTVTSDTNYLQYTGADHVVLGGTAGNDIIIAGDGDDTIFGDGGNDRLEGGYGNDHILGGDGDDIIQDAGGDDVIDGGAGNDVIQAGAMSAVAIGNLVFGGDGNDFIINREDITTSFGGLGDDFILGAKTDLGPTGNEGDDWIELGTQDGSPGDNFSPALADEVVGNDIFVGGGGFDEMIGEGGDDIFVGSDAQDKMEGMSGFDWVTYKNDFYGVTADLTLAALAQPHGETPGTNVGAFAPVGASPASIFDRFSEVEGLSGSRFADILRGDDIDAVTILNHGGATGGALTNVALINGLQALLGAGAAGFATGNIILGGAGSDLIEGRGGDDLIDGDRWLNVKINVYAANDPNHTGPAIRSVDSMEDLIADMLSGAINPGQLKAVREILDDNNDFDTAVYQGLSTEYTWTELGGGVVRVEDTVAGRDGVDTLKNVERLQFADGSFVLAAGVGRNTDPDGLATITDTNGGVVTVGDRITASVAGVTDADNPGTGAITTSVGYTWQVERTPGTGIFEDIVLLPGGDLAFQSADGRAFVVTPDLAGLSLRVKAIYQDAQGVTETVFSTPTDPVAPGAGGIVVPAAPVADVTAGGEGIHLARSDLSFILDQIKIAEANAAGESLASLLPNARAALGLRTVDGSFNNLMNPEFGAADNPFPRVVDPVFDTAEAGTSYNQTSGNVIDSQPRTISNLLVDQTAANKAAYTTAYDPGINGHLDFGVVGDLNDDVLKDGVEIVQSPGLDGVFGTPDDKDVFFFPNVAPDEGLSAPFNSWMTFFGQFFDHGLDLVTKGGNGSVFIPLQPDDPLYVPGSPTNFMVLTRATQVREAGADGVLNTSDDTFHGAMNTTSPFIDQNQTYSSHPSHQVFLRAYELGLDGQPHATGELIENRDLGGDGLYGTDDDVPIGGMATWEVVKAQARDILGINLTDADVGNLPMLATDAYGNFLKGPNGFPQVVMAGNVLVEGNPAAPISLANAVRTGHAFLDDIAHNAVPVLLSGVLQPDADTATGNAQPVGPGGNNLTYDNELLDAHYIAGDGRANENIGLTAVHAIFHSEHNRLVQHTKDTILLTNDVAFLSEWLAPGTAPATFPDTPAEIAALQWNGERLFQAAKFGTEMQYQHLVFEEFARTIQPNVDLFFAPTQVYDVDLDASIVAEFAHTVYRFGHSMLTETVDRLDADFAIVDDPSSAGDQQLGLIAAFLNPLAYAASGLTPEEATGAIVRGVTRQVGNEIDEFVTVALRNNLVGLPLDLAALNIARGRDTGIPSLNEVRRDIYNQTGDSNLKPYTSWADLVQHLKHPESVINFIAAYGKHGSITGATTLAGKRDAATLLVLGGLGEPADRLDFLNSTGAWANGPNGVTISGLDDIDLWIGGLAEEKMAFGGMLGSTFNFIFENQLEKLQDGDRFYYLERTAGLAFNAELEGNSFAKMIMANSDATHLPGLVFTTPGYILEVDQTKQHTGLGDGKADPLGDNPLLPLVIRDNPETAGPDTNYLRYAGGDHVVLGGTDNADILIASDGDDTIWGDGGNDRIEGGNGVDQLRGGDGDDIITDLGGDDNIQGGDGHDVIHGGNGINLIIGGAGSDFIVTGEDASEAIGGQGNDFILGSKANEQDMGNEGDDWIEKGTSDGAPGDNFDPLGNDPVIGNDVFIGDGEHDKFNGEGGDDIMVGKVGFGDRFIGGSGFDWASFKGDTVGVHIDMSDRFFDQPLVPGGTQPLARFDIMEGLSGSEFADVLNGDNVDDLAAGGATGSILTNFALIDGLEPLISRVIQTDTVTGTRFFDGGNIILGGGGSDQIEGRGGNDFIDGDAWLNVRISVRAGIGPDGLPTGPEIATFDSMVEMVPFMLSGQYNPGQLQIVREIKDGGQALGTDFDTAVFSGVFESDYITGRDGNNNDIIERLANYDIVDNGDGTFTVTHLVRDADGVITGVGVDGVDTLRGIERLVFAEPPTTPDVPAPPGSDPIQTAFLLDNSNDAPAGQLTISDATPAEDQTLRVSIAGVTDADNTATEGAIPNPVAYFWQQEIAPDVWEDILGFGNGEVERAHGTTFTTTDAEVGTRLRVRAVYKDQNGVLEQVYSAPTAAVENINDAPVITGPLISDTTPTETLAISAIPNFTDADGLTTAIFTYQWRMAVTQGPGGAAGPFIDIVGATGQTFTPGANQVNRSLQVVITYTDDQGTTQTVTSAATTVVGDFVGANGAGQTLIGTEGQDIINGGGGGDTIITLGEDDIINGGTGNDTIDAGAGNDIINYAVGDGNDGVNGGTGTDLLALTGTGGNNTLAAIFNGGATIAGVEGGTVLNVETVTLDLGANGAAGDTLSYNPGGAPNTTVAVTVDLSTGTASGFTSIAGVENVTGGAGGDTITGNANANVIDGGDGNNVLTGGGGGDQLIGGGNSDRFVATVGDGNDSYNGNGGVDTYDLSGTSAGATVSIAGANLSSTSAETGTDSLISIENINGSQGDDSITVNGAVNVIDGQGGNDTINAGGNNDTIRGGLGNDTINGQAGNDNLFGDAGDDTFIYTVGDGADTVDGGADFDRLNVVAAGGAQTLNVVLNGTTMTVGGGVVSNVELLNASLGGGSDTISFAGSSVGVSVNLGAGTASGGFTLTSVENATGGNGNDTLIGVAGANNTLTGGGGDDTFTVHDTGDTVSEAAGGGTDTVLSLANSYTLSNNVENLTYIGTGNFTGTGNNGNNTITGGTGADTLNGGGGNGADIIIGGAGADTINTGAGNDNVADRIVFNNSADYGDTVSNFDANGTAASNDDVVLAGLLNGIFDDIALDDAFQFVSGTGNGAVGVAADIATTAEALYLGGTAGEGVTSLNLANAGLVANAFNAEFDITGAGDALLVINDTGGGNNNFAVWQYVEDGATAEIQTNELTLIGTFSANATVQVTDFHLG